MTLKKLIEPVYDHWIKEERQMENEGSVDELSVTDFGRHLQEDTLDLPINAAFKSCDSLG